MTENDQAINETTNSLINESCVKTLNTEKLFGKASEILISHAGECYMLSITKQKKLLLTKAKQNFQVK